MQKRILIYTLILVVPLFGFYIYKKKYIDQQANQLIQQGLQIQTVIITQDERGILERHKETLPTGVVSEEFTTLNGIRNGKAKTFYPDGQLRSEDNWANGQLDGLIKRYLETGKLFSVNNFKNGKMHGENITYYPSGTIKEKTMMLNNKPNGRTIIYAQNGHIIGDYVSINGKSNGPAKFYYDNGQLKEEGASKDGKKNGEFKFYREDGTVQAIVRFENDEKNGVAEWYYKNGRMKTHGFYKNNKLHGLTTWYSKSGHIDSKKEYIDDKENGLEHRYFLYTNKIEETNTYRNGVKDGPSKRYYSNGVLKSTAQYFKDKINGRYTLYTPDGEILADFEFRNNMITKKYKMNKFLLPDYPDINIAEKIILLKIYVGILLVAEEFEALEDIAADLRQGKAGYAEGKKIHFFYNGITDGFEDIYEKNINLLLSNIKKWGNYSDDSLTQKIAYIAAKIDEAWFYRGGGFSSTVTEEGQRKWKRALKEGRAVGNELESINKTDPFLYECLIRINMGQVNNYKQIKAYVLDALRIDPAYHHVLGNATHAMLPIWGGAEGEVERFAEWAVEQTKENTGYEAYARIAEYVRKNRGNERYHSFNFAYPDYKQGLTDMLGRYPDSLFVKQRLAWIACQTKDKQEAKEILNNIDVFWGERTQNLWSDYDTLAGWKDWTNDKVDYLGLPEIFKYILNNKYKKIAQYIDAGKDINIQNGEGETPLVFAMKNRFRYSALDLIKNRADINIADNEGLTVLHYAAMWGYDRIFEFLVEHGADYNAKDSYSYKAIHFAAQYQNKRIIAFLLTKRDVDINEQTSWKRTPLHIAAYKGYTDIIEQLLKVVTLKLNVQDRDGDTPLHLATKKGQEQVVKQLIKAGTRMDIKNNAGQTPVDIAREKSNKAIIKMLEKIK
ncbi:MAG: ankyrin repeat domain-containing protein [Candidatus Omnitrophica bacterium]|nr:ankyrin repeat domain-containing protein [Candidatus Omnitrophota bacterium]